MKAAVITMVRSAEFPTAWSCLRTLEPQLGPDVIQFLLLNDARDPELEARLTARAHTRLLTPGRNLGVARGRNELIAAALAWGADILVSLDDDLLVAAGYVERICDWIAERRAAGEPIGVVTPAVLDFHEVAPLAMTRRGVRAAEAGTLRRPIPLERIRRALRKQGPQLSAGAFYHAGIRDWEANYLRTFSPRARRLQSFLHSAAGTPQEPLTPAELRLDPAIRRAATERRSEAVSIDSAPGGACAYPADLIREIGTMDGAFSPFGYEDADFAIRALRAGFENYLLPSELVLHDLDARKRDRDVSMLVFTQARARALIARKHADAAEVQRILIEAAALGAAHALDLSLARTEIPGDRTGTALVSALCFFSGFLDGLFAPVTDTPDGAGRSSFNVPACGDFRADGLRLRLWDGSPLSGLPKEILLHAALVYSWEEESGHFDLRHLEVDAPGLAVLRMSASMGGIGRRTEGGRPEPLAATLDAFHGEFHDHGFLRRLETSIAWQRRERSPGYLASLLNEPATDEGKRFRWFLSLRQQPASLTIDLAPDPAVSALELERAEAGSVLRRRLGLHVGVAAGSSPRPRPCRRA